MHTTNFDDYVAEVTDLGNGQEKSAVFDDGHEYLMQISDGTAESDNAIVAEYLGLKISRELAMSATMPRVGYCDLGTYTNQGKPRVAIIKEKNSRDSRSVLWTEAMQGSALSFDNIKVFFEKSGLNAKAFAEFCGQYVVNAFIGNTSNVTFSFDNASLSVMNNIDNCLSASHTDAELTYALAKSEALSLCSKLTDKNWQSLNYRESLMDASVSSISSALLEIVHNINLDRINDWIYETPFISDRRRKFYCDLLNLRYELVLIPALERALGIPADDGYEKLDDQFVNGVYQKFIAPFTNAPTIGTVEWSPSKPQYCKNNGYVFFLSDYKRTLGYEIDDCIGMASLVQSKQGVYKFLTSAKEIGVEINP